MTWFAVDKAGLAGILERRGKFFAVAELVSNAWDSGATEVAIELTPVAGEPYATIAVHDNGEGFADLSHAFTMFAKSSRAGHAEKRGRFNLGEKLVLAVCRSGWIATRSGTIRFNSDGTTRKSGETHDGTSFVAEIRMTRDELDDVNEQMRRLIPPVNTTYNGKPIGTPAMLAKFETKLPTEIAGDDGLRRTVRTATVEVYEGDGQVLELGIPVVETDNGYRVNVLQKIPLNMERDNVTPGFLRTLNAALLNVVHDHLTADEAAAPWAQEAASDSRATPAAVKSVIAKRFGERAVIATPGDVMANANAEAAGFTVIPGGAMPAGLWANIRKHELLTPAGQAFPTPKPEDLAERAKGKCPLCGKSLL